MATTEYGVNHPMAVKKWSKDLMKEALKRTSILPFMGTGTNSLIQIKTELNKDAGDRIRYGLRMQLNGAGILGDGTLEGNEEALQVYTDDVFIDQLRHAVRSEGKMSEQRVPFSVRAEARDGLADWWADRIDTAAFNQLGGNTAQADVRFTGMQATVAPDADHQIFPGGHTAEASLSAGNVFDLTLLDFAVELAETAQNPIRPVQLGQGRKAWVCFLHPYQVTDLRTNTSTGQWLDIQKAAMTGGQVTKNPIFTGALGMYNNVILHSNTRVPVGGSSQDGGALRRAIFCGAQSGMVAYGKMSGKNTYSWKEELFDYENQLGVAAGSIYGCKKTRFNGSDFATVVISTAASAST